MPDWFADESFWASLFPFEFGETAIAAGETQVERVIALSGVERGDVLDLGCGPGRHAVPLAKRGFRVTGVDLSAFHLDKARRTCTQPQSGRRLADGSAEQGANGKGHGADRLVQAA